MIFTQATIQNISAEKYAGLLVPICSIEEQMKVVKEIDALSNGVRNVVNKHNDIIAKLEEYRKSIIYNAVTGKIDCRTEAS